MKVTAVKLKCDHCDWFEENNLLLETMTEHINRSCPRCGENVFTFDDYEKTLAMLEVAKELEKLSKIIGESNSIDDSVSNDKKVVGFNMECSRDGKLTITEKEAS